MNEQEKLERLMEYSRQLAQQNASNSNNESEAQSSTIHLNMPDLPDLSQSRSTDSMDAPDVSMPNLTADWDSIWNSGNLSGKASVSSSQQDPFELKSNSNQTSHFSPSQKDSEDKFAPQKSTDNKFSPSEVDDDQYNWTRTRSTLRAAKGTLESYERSLNNPDDFRLDAESDYLKPIDQIVGQSSNSAPESKAAPKSQARFTADDFNVVNTAPQDSASQIRGTMRPTERPLPIKTLQAETPQPVCMSNKNPSSPSMLPSEKIIASVKHLYKSFTKGGITVPVLQDLSFDVVRGEFTAIVGQSGSGKSTLLNAMGLLCKIDAGTILYENKRIDNISSYKKDKIRNCDFGLVFQFYHLLPEFNLLENILMPMSIRYSVFEWGWQKRQCRQRAMELIHKVGLEHRVYHKPREMSGGEMQRAAIARALITSPKLLLADEPTGNLDQKTGREILELLYSLQRDEKLTILMVTHDPSIAQEADRTYHLSEGNFT